MSAQLTGADGERPATPEPAEWTETFAALVAVSAAAHALDGLYGTVKPLVRTNFADANRRGQILKTLELGFDVGWVAQTHWASEFDWLYQIRDGAVHHAEAMRPMVTHRTTDETVVYGAPEMFGTRPSAHAGPQILWPMWCGHA